MSTGAWSIPAYLFLGILICGIELLRPKFHPVLDFLRPVSLLYLLAFSLTPLLVQVLGLADIIQASYMPLQAAGDWTYFLGASVSTVGYVAIVVGFYWQEILRPHALLNVPVRCSQTSAPTKVSIEMLVLAGSALMLLGAGAMWIYASSLGGIKGMLEYTVLVRAGARPAGPWAFLKPLMPLTAVASYFYYGAWWRAESHVPRWTCAMLFIIAFFVALLSYYTLGARQTIITYFLAFVIARSTNSGRWNLLATCGVLFIIVLVWLFGKSAFYWFYYPEGLSSQLEYMERSWRQELPMAFLGELSFAYMSTVNAIGSAPWHTDFRWFLDFLWSILYIIPEFLLPDQDLPSNIYKINTILMRGEGSSSTVPIGLDSLGYYSFGIAGTIIVCFLFGAALRFFEHRLAAENNPGVAALRAATMMYMMLRVTYADPVFALQEAFALLSGLVIYWMMQLSVTRQVREPAAGGRCHGAGSYAGSGKPGLPRSTDS